MTPNEAVIHAAHTEKVVRETVIQLINEYHDQPNHQQALHVLLGMLVCEFGWDLNN